MLNISKRHRKSCFSYIYKAIEKKVYISAEAGNCRELYTKKFYYKINITKQ